MPDNFPVGMKPYLTTVDFVRKVKKILRDEKMRRYKLREHFPVGMRVKCQDTWYRKARNGRWVKFVHPYQIELLKKWARETVVPTLAWYSYSDVASWTPPDIRGKYYAKTKRVSFKELKPKQA